MSSQSPFDGFFEFEKADRFGEVRRCARLHAIFDIGGHALGGNHDDGNACQRRVAPHQTQDIQPGDFGHHDVEQDDIGFFGGHHGYGWGALGG